MESRDSEHAEVVFFAEREGTWLPLEGAPVLELQDPFHTRIGGELVVGGVEIYPHPEKENALLWRTVFYRGQDVRSLKPFFRGPDGMKDLRLIELADGDIGVFTRPQGEKGGRGKIGYTRVKSLDELTLAAIDDAPLLQGQFAEGEWGGANEAHRLVDGRVGVLGHVASFDEAGDRHYYPMAFVFDPSDESFTAMKLIAERSRFLPGPSKRPDLQDVVFSGGLVRREDGSAVLYAGISDADAQRIVIADPFRGL